MAKCKCGGKRRIVSDIVHTMNDKNCHCRDVCATPICADPDVLGIMAPLIYDEIGINLCTTFSLGTDIPAAFNTATNARISVAQISFTYGDENVQIEAIAGRPNCYVITLSNITVTFAVRLYDANCRFLGTLYPTAVYLPSSTTAPTYDEDTNPSSVELEIFAPYGTAYSSGTTPTPILNVISLTTPNNTITQGINIFGMAKLLDLNVTEQTVTVGLTLVLQSLYFAGYKVKSAGKIDIPKGSILTPDDSDCIKFVAGDLLNLAIKPLDIGYPSCEEATKEECCNSTCTTGCCKCVNECGPCADGISDDNISIIPPPA